MRELFARLQAEIEASTELDATLAACVRLIRTFLPGVAAPHLQREMKDSCAAVERYLEGDPSGMGQEFDELVNTPPEVVDEERFCVFLVKHVADESRFVPLCMHYRVNRRVHEAQQVLRSPEFVRSLARRIGVESFPPAILLSRVQGVEVIHYAGHQRYAIFSDFVAGLGRDGCDTRGGMLLNVLSDEFLEADLPAVAAAFPGELRRLEALGVMRPATLRFLFPIFLTLHDTLGHTLPNSLNHPTKVAAGGFLVDPMEEVGADAQFFWVATSSEGRGFLRRIMSDEEIAALPVIWLLKRACHYPRRGFADDPLAGRLMIDSDARCGVLEFNFFRAAGAIVPVGDGFEIDREVLPAACGRLLDEWLEIESRIGEGVDGYAAALADFTRRFGSAGADGAWTTPEELRLAYRRAEAAAPAA